MLLVCFEFRLFFSKGIYDLALLEDGLFQVRDEPRDFVEVCASSFPSAREFEAGGFISSGESDNVVLSSFVSSRDPPDLVGLPLSLAVSVARRDTGAFCHTMDVYSEPYLKVQASKGAQPQVAGSGACLKN